MRFTCLPSTSTCAKSDETRMRALEDHGPSTPVPAGCSIAPPPPRLWRDLQPPPTGQPPNFCHDPFRLRPRTESGTPSQVG